MTEKKSVGHQTMTGPGYRVYIRATDKPVTFGDAVVGTEWERLPTAPSSIGVTRSIEQTIADVFPYHAAVALASWFVNEAGYRRVEAKIVRYKIEVRQEVWEDGEPMELENAIEMMFKKASADNSSSGHS